MKHISFDFFDREWLTAGSPEPEWEDWSRETNGDRQRLQRNLEKACAQILTPRQKVLVTMYFSQEMTMREIAETLQINTSTVSRTIKRAKRRLYDYLQYSL